MADWDLGIPVLAEVIENEIVVQQIIVNNEIHEMTTKAQSLCCSSCGKSLFTFSPDTQYEDAYQQVMASKENLQLKLQICPGCGKKLRYDFDFIDGELVNE